MASLLLDAFVVSVCDTLGLHEAGAPAKGRMAVRNATAELHKKWAFASGVHRLKPTPENVSRFIQESFDIPFEMENRPDGRTLSRTERDAIFTRVAQILVGQGRFEFEC